MKTASHTPARAPIPIYVLVFPNFLLLDATGPVQVFSSANDDARDAGLAPPYRIELIAQEAGSIASSSGVSVLASPIPRAGLKCASLIIAGGRVANLPADAKTLRWVARASAEVARCCAVCTGAFVLARAGLLDGRRAVTHWQETAQLQREHPDVLVQEDAIYVKDGALYTSAGICAGMDLALSLVEEDLGRPAALRVAKRLVMFLRRPGGQRQFSSERLSAAQPEGLTGQLAAWLRQRLKQQIDVEQMAQACAVSVRTLHRKLRQESDLTPAQLLARLRMEAACSLLEQPGMSVKQAAHQSGHGSEYNLRRAFSMQLGVLPSDYQARFA